MIWSAVTLLVALLIAASRGDPLLRGRKDCSGAATVHETRFPNVTWNNDLWQLTTSNLEQGRYQSWMTVANGYHGSSVSALGPFFELNAEVNGDSINGWPLFERRQTLASIGYFWDSQPRTNGTNFPWLYQYGWDTAVSGIPHWGGIAIDLGDAGVLDANTDNSTITNFKSTLDMKQGLMNWQFTWTPEGHGPFDVTYQMFAHKVRVNTGLVNMTIKSHSAANVTIINILDGDGALRTNATGKGSEGDLIYSAVSPWGVENVTAYVFAGLSIAGAQSTVRQSSWTASYIGNNQSSIASAVDVDLPAGQLVSVVKYVGIASSDAFPNPRETAMTAAINAQQMGYDNLLQSHIQEWAALFPTTSVDDFSFPQNGSLPDDPDIIELAITAVTNPYHLLQQTVSLNATHKLGNASINSHSISVGGLGSTSYAGQIFWDADIWMHPGLVAAFPYAASSITNYRKKLYPQALLNAQTSYQSSKNHTNFSSNAAAYPWTSGRYGNCTGTGPCFDYQYHLNGDIVLALLAQWLATGDADFKRNDLFPITDSVATLYSELLEKNGSYWSLANMTDPDEYANMVDNGGYTMSLIAETLDTANSLRQSFNMSINSTWTSQAQSVLIGRDENAGITLEYTGPVPQNGSIVVKQADIVLIPYPLSFFEERYTAEYALADLEYYSNKQSPDGPAMTYAIFSIVANEVSTSGCSAFTYHQYSYHPYVRGPWFQFSEQLIDDASVNGGTHPAFPFLTGHGGAYQVLPYGYLGLRYVDNDHLNIDPAPPPQIPHIRYRTIYWQGWPISAYSNASHTTLSRQIAWNPASGTTPNGNYTTNSIPVLVGPSSNPSGLQTYQLEPNGTLTIPNRQTWRNLTVPSNVAQCQPVPSTNSEFVPGQFPISAVDGATSTRWQPVYANVTSSITVSLPLGYEVTSLQFDWSTQTPYNYSVVFHNSSSPSSWDSLLVVSDSQVIISNPADTQESLTIRKVVGNTTTVYFNETNISNPNVSAYSISRGPLYTSSYATLSIWGNQFNSSYTVANMSGEGATVAEFSVVVSDLGEWTSGSGYEHVKRDGEKRQETAGTFSSAGFGSGFVNKLRRSTYR